MERLFVRKFHADALQAPRGSTPFQLPPAFPENTPVDLEIGCGVGFHPIQRSQQEPRRFLIAIEHTAEKFSKFQRRVNNHPTIKNLLPIHADAIPWISRCLPVNSIDQVFLLYPNPNPKNESKRWIRMPFFSELLAKLKAEATMTIATNEAWYMDEVRLYASEWWKLSIVEDSKITLENTEGKARTHFEKKYLLAGQTCYNLVLKKSAQGKESCNEYNF